MKVLIVPMLAVAQTEGPFSRSKILANACLEKRIQVAFCMEAATNKPVNGAICYPLSVPVPMGLPKWLGLRTYPLADKLGIIGRKTVHSFEEVLYLTGSNAYPYLKSSIDEIRSAIRDFSPDVVYSEFNLSAIIAANAENIPVLASYSFPAQDTYATSPQFAGGFNKILKRLGQPPVTSSLELFQRTDCRIIPSSSMLEPVSGDKILFVGPFKRIPPIQTSEHKNCILVYLGNGTVSKKRIRKVIFEAFRSTPYEVYLAGMPNQEDYGNIHIAQRFNFSELLPKTVVYINHGGQNSIMDGFLYGIPQLICPGKVFERKYNADSVVNNKAGLAIDLSKFQADILSATVEHLISNEGFGNNATELGRSFSSLGGADAVADYIIRHY